MPKPHTSENLVKALHAARQAVALDPRSAEAYFQLGYAHSYAGDPDKGIAAAERCLSLNRNHGYCHVLMATLLICAARSEKATAWVQKAIELSPRDPNMNLFYWNAGQAELNMGHYDAAIEATQRSIMANEGYPWPYVALPAACAHQDRLKTAGEALSKFASLQPHAATVAVVRERYLGRSINPLYRGQVERHLIAGLRKAGLPE